MTRMCKAVCRIRLEEVKHHASVGVQKGEKGEKGDANHSL